MDKQTPTTSNGVGNRGSDSRPEASNEIKKKADQARAGQDDSSSDSTNSASQQGEPDAPGKTIKK